VKVATKFRQNAFRFRKLADRGTTAEEGESLLRLAEHWDRLAQEADYNPEAFENRDDVF
jgi:hypothetical protein